jgi:hypothetical protein
MDSAVESSRPDATLTSSHRIEIESKSEAIKQVTALLSQWLVTFNQLIDLVEPLNQNATKPLTTSTSANFRNTMYQ